MGRLGLPGGPAQATSSECFCAFVKGGRGEPDSLSVGHRAKRVSSLALYGNVCRPLVWIAAALHVVLSLFRLLQISRQRSSLPERLEQMASITTMSCKGHSGPHGDPFTMEICGRAVVYIPWPPPSTKLIEDHVCVWLTTGVSSFQNFLINHHV